MHETRRDAFVDIAAFLHLHPTLIANQRKTPVKRRARETGDSSMSAAFKIDFGADEILRGGSKNLRSSPPGYADRPACELHEHITEVNAQGGPGTGRCMARIASPVRRIHLAEIVVADIGVHVQQAPEFAALKQASHLFHRRFVSPFMADAECAPGIGTG